jgi:hypothetical protein
MQIGTSSIGENRFITCMFIVIAGASGGKRGDVGPRSAQSDRDCSQAAAFVEEERVAVDEAEIRQGVHLDVLQSGGERGGRRKIIDLLLNVINCYMYYILFV